MLKKRRRARWCRNRQPARRENPGLNQWLVASVMWGCCQQTTLHSPGTGKTSQTNGREEPTLPLGGQTYRPDSSDSRHETGDKQCPGHGPLRAGPTGPRRRQTTHRHQPSTPPDSPRKNTQPGQSQKPSPQIPGAASHTATEQQFGRSEFIWRAAGFMTRTILGTCAGGNGNSTRTGAVYLTHGMGHQGTETPTLTFPISASPPTFARPPRHN